MEGRCVLPARLCALHWPAGRPQPPPGPNRRRAPSTASCSGDSAVGMMWYVIRLVSLPPRSPRLPSRKPAVGAGTFMRGGRYCEHPRGRNRRRGRRGMPPVAAPPRATRRQPTCAPLLTRKSNQARSLGTRMVTGSAFGSGSLSLAPASPSPCSNSQVSLSAPWMASKKVMLQGCGGCTDERKGRRRRSVRRPLEGEAATRRRQRQLVAAGGGARAGRPLASDLVVRCHPSSTWGRSGAVQAWGPHAARGPPRHSLPLRPVGQPTRLEAPAEHSGAAWRPALKQKLPLGLGPSPSLLFSAPETR